MGKSFAGASTSEDKHERVPCHTIMMTIAQAVLKYLSIPPLRKPGAQ
jgi:hypothetical protein